MADELFDALNRFHREVWLPENRQMVRDEVGELRREMLSHFDDVYVRFGRLEDEYQIGNAALKRLADGTERSAKRSSF